MKTSPSGISSGESPGTPPGEPGPTSRTPWFPEAVSNHPPSRLLGLETEYAIRYSGWGPRPGNDQIYDALLTAIDERVAFEPGGDQPEKKQVFLENGGSFNYEHASDRPHKGLIEGATPECRSPTQLLRYQKAQELLLQRCLPRAGQILRERGWSGEVGLLKNCRDAEGNVYGAQENYQAQIAHGPLLLLYRLGLIALLPLIAVHLLLCWTLYLLLIPAILLLGLGVLGATLLVPALRRHPWVALIAQGDQRELDSALGRYQLWLAYFQLWPVAFPFCWLLRMTAFRCVRRRAAAFLISRPVLSGTGTVEADGRFGLSEKGPAMRRWMRGSLRPKDRSVFDTGNLLKQAVMPLNLRFGPLIRLFERRQRLQLGLSDSSGAQVAELLKIATTALVLDMIEEGFLNDVPRPRDPLAALRAVVEDPTLRAEVEMTDGSSWTALRIQRFYLERARRFVAGKGVESLETREILALWEETLRALEEGDFGRLIGRLDWVTKRFLVEMASEELPADAPREAVEKTLDLRYHELGEGYLAQMEREGLATVLVSQPEVERALTEPPEDSPAQFRGRLIRDHRSSPVPMRVSWTSAWIGERFQGRVVDFRRPPEA